MNAQEVDVTLGDLVLGKLKAMEAPLEVVVDEDYESSVISGVDLPEFKGNEVYEALSDLVARKLVCRTFSVRYKAEYGDMPDPKNTMYWVAEFAVAS